MCCSILTDLRHHVYLFFGGFLQHWLQLQHIFVFTSQATAEQ